MCPINGISVGKDITVTLANTNGSITINRVKSFTSQQKNKNLETIALDGINRHLNIPIGWSGSFEMERTSVDIDNFFYQLEQNYASGNVIPLTTITETITETNGATSQFQYTGGVIQFDSTGDWKGDELITQKINFMASSRTQLS